MDDTSSTGDVIAAELREGFEAFDFGIPVHPAARRMKLRDHIAGHHRAAGLHRDECRSTHGLLGKGDTFISQDLQSATLFGDYRVDGAVMNVGGYNDYLSAPDAAHQPGAERTAAEGQQDRHASGQALYLQVNTAELTGWLDDYIWTQLFGEHLQPAGG
jgi:type III restriction enzyme